MEQIFNCNGVILSPVDVRDYKIATSAIATSFPDTFERKLTKVKNQGVIGACTGFAISSCAESFNDEQGTDCGEMSPASSYGNRLHSDYIGVGACLRDALSGWLHEGLCPLTMFPENLEVPDVIEKFLEKRKNPEFVETCLKFRISSYFRVLTKAEIKTALMNYGPVLFVIPWYSDFKCEKGVLSSSKGEITGLHCMMIYGWDKTGWKIQNSWGITWGRKGRAILPYDFELSEAWGLTDNIKDGINKKGFFATWFGNIIAKCINLLSTLLNLLKK